MLLHATTRPKTRRFQSAVRKSFCCLATGLCAVWLSFPVAAQVVEGVDYSDRAGVDNTFDMAGTDIFGQRFPSESLTIADPVTGVKITALTTSRHSSSKIYQDHPNWTANGRHIVFSSNRNTAAGGNVTFARDRDQPRHVRQFYAISMDDHEIVQVTTGNTGYLLLGHKKNVAFHLRDHQVVELNLDRLLADSKKRQVKAPAQYERVVASLPDSLDPGGMCLDITDKRIFFSTRAGDDRSAIYSVDFDHNRTEKLVEVPFRTGHFQANPYVSGEMMYCWETGGDAPQRTWVLTVDKNGKVTNRPAYKEKANEWVTHEVFAGPDHILFNVMGHLDRLRKNPTGVMLTNIRTGETKRLGQAEELGGYWHAAGTKDLKWGVADTFNGNIYRLNLETGDATLLTTGHRPGTQSPFSSQAHAHQSISPDGKWVLFNSSMLTDSDIMMVPLHPQGL
ncbi:oligogalacturonide lyase [Catalinimonas alkaloidigena]|uniref:Oligogalacturonide lyase n=1 Tax=Catalinimonas alkaloidigena TaxID=1075417 RepID=A0A1G8XJ55_9BACT|nr:PD40 domain-containing protein [Catalinimonas alkaloidigena]SDJ90516.1 oligogalacturonide lyase [Catalinimonas alkaloidigena]